MSGKTPPQQIETLLECLRWDERGDEALRQLDGAQWDVLWQLLVAGDGQHFLAMRNRRANIRPPDRIAEALRIHTMSIAADNLARRQAITGIIQTAGRPALLLKGIDIAWRIYPNIGSRPMGDSDILVHADDITTYDLALRRCGYDCSWRVDTALPTSGAAHHFVYQRTGDSRSRIELHWQLSDDDDYIPIDLNGVWRRAAPEPQGLPNAFVMAPEDLLLYLCLHSWHHNFDTSLNQLWDLAEVLTAPHCSIDWPVLWLRAEEWRLTAVVRIALYLISERLGVPTRHLSDWIPDAELAGLLPDVVPQLDRYPQHGEHINSRLAAVFSSTSTWRERLAVTYQVLFPPRADVRMAYGKPGDRFLADCWSYVRRWRERLRARRDFLSAMIGRKPSVRTKVERIAALRRRLAER